MLQLERLRMLHKMHRQLALIHFTAEHKGWGKLSMLASAKGMSTFTGLQMPELL